MTGELVRFRWLSVGALVALMGLALVSVLGYGFLGEHEFRSCLLRDCRWSSSPSGDRAATPTATGSDRGTRDGGADARAHAL